MAFGFFPSSGHAAVPELNIPAVFESGPDEIPRFSFAARGGFWLPEDDDFRRFYGIWTHDIYFLELGFRFFNNFYLQGAAGGYYERSHTIGTITPDFSGEELAIVLVPLETGLGYRFNFLDQQILVPYLGGGYDWIYFHEDADPGSPVEGWKQGWTAWGGLLLLLDRLEPGAAWNNLTEYGIDNTYLELAARYQTAGQSESGLDFSGPVYTLGVLFEF